jgi:outer membrane protein assembly factor BamB
VDDQPNLVISSSSDGAADIPVNPPAAQRDQRYLALDEQTGSTVWKVEVPKGSLGTGIWSDYYSLGGMTELSSTGLLRIRDLGTGAVTATHQLDWSGTILRYTTGTLLPGAAPAVRDQVVVYKAGDRGADVYDRGSGRLLWHWQDRSLYGLFSCAPELYCVQSQDGMGALDAHNGRPVWSVQRYNSILQLGSGIMLLTRWDETDPLTASGVAAVNVRTGQVLWALDNWSVVQDPLNRVIVWKPLDNRTALLGVVDPRTSQVTVFDKAENWNGRPECVQSDDHLACAVAGRLSVWKLP